MHTSESEASARHDAPETSLPARRGRPSNEPSSMPQIELGDLKIDRAGEIPIGVQLAWALRARIGDGRLRPGQRLPGLRDLAEMLGINANTVRGVYQRLEREGMIDSMQGTGTFVASATMGPSPVGEIAADAAREARRTGVDPREVAAALYVTAEPRADPVAETAERRRQLRTQIAALEQALSELQTQRPELLPALSDKPPRYAGPRLLGIEELEQVRASLIRRLAGAEPLPEAPRETASAPAQKRRGQTRAAGADGSTKPAKAKQPSVTPRATPRPSTA
jgi:DNA-binding transcriptional regulator YhcF (GntR family)